MQQWNTVYLEKAVTTLKELDTFDETLLEHISLLGWKHINFLGEYLFSVTDDMTFQTLKSLDSRRTKSTEIYCDTMDFGAF
ncbi:hypothetical protein DUK53_11170 [Listeria sp. SHR_NRA_18]|uniref:Tn3 family transposase n=1 Tax=Listeria newyorkensis TaxID=1497681 RepID=UPI00098E4E58|nr:hypothetical protein DUK53_11170 [Listeria sp. SHR_NRA_18]